MLVEIRPIFVIDTNILIDYPDIIPPKEGKMELKEPTVDLSKALIVIPTAVIRELSSFKKEKTERGKVARAMLKRLREMFEGIDSSLDGSYTLDSGIAISKTGETYPLDSGMPLDDIVPSNHNVERVISILPVHKNFKKCLPFSPSEDDMDGQIILATLATEFIVAGLSIDGTLKREGAMNFEPSGFVKLLTNDNGLAIRAGRRGIFTSRYGYMPPPPYTGRREVEVPKELFDYFYDKQKIELDIWQMEMPEESERPLIANEFIIMHLKNPDDYPPEFVYDLNPYFRHIGRYDAESKAIVALEYIADFPEPIMNDGQAIYAEALMNPNFAAVICQGPAGSGKTYMATVYGCDACKKGQYIGVTVVPCASQSKIGALPGDLNEKMDPEVQPIKNAIRNYLLKTDRGLKAELKELREHGAKVPKPRSENACTNGEENEDQRSIRQKLRDRINAIWDAWFSNLPIENARGRDFSYEVALYDEFQDQNTTQADTLLKRLGMEGKIVITGDTEQVHAPYLDSSNNGLVYASHQLKDNPMVAQVCFVEKEVIRHPLVKAIAERQKADRMKKSDI